MRNERVAHSVVKWNKLMNKRANISHKLSQPGVVTCFHKVSISELGNRKHIPHLWDKIVMNWATTLPPSILFLSVPETSPRLWSFMSGRMNVSAKSLQTWTMKTFLLQWRWRGEKKEGLESGWLYSTGRDFQGDLVWIDLQFILQPLFVMCFASSCTLNLNCSKLNYRDHAAHISIRTTKNCTKSHRDTSDSATMGLHMREEQKELTGGHYAKL